MCIILGVFRSTGYGEYGDIGAMGLDGLANIKPLASVYSY
jgi:hypothetical protein